MAPTRPIPPPSPEALVALWRDRGDPEALGALFDQTAPALFRVAMSLTRDAVTAEEVLQETYLEAIESFDRYDAARPVTPWLVGILKMAVRRAHRAGARRPDLVRVADSRPVEGAAGETGDGEEARLVRAAIDELQEPYRSVALLRWRYGLDPAEIADVRGEPPGTIRSLLSRALAQMKGRLRGSAAMLLFAPTPLGLDAVRRVVMDRARSLAPTGAAAGGLAATAAAGVSWRVLLLSAASVGALAVGAATYASRREAAPAAAPAAPARQAPSPEAGTPPPPEEPRPHEATTPPSEPPPLPSAEPSRPVDAPVVPVPPQAGLSRRPPTAPSRTPRDPESPPEPPTPDTPDGAEPEPEPRRRVADVPPPPPAISSAKADAAKGAEAVLPHPTGPVPTTDLAARIDTAIADGVRWLRERQRSDGSWGSGILGSASYGGGPAPEVATMPAGPTALALYALLKSGVPADDPVVVRGFKHLLDRTKVPDTAYEASAMLLAITATGERDAASEGKRAGKVRLTAPMRSWALRLEAALVKAQDRGGGWRYALGAGAPPTPGGPGDLSSTHLATLALLEAARCGIAAPPDVWRSAIAFAQRQQEPDGPTRPRAVVEERGSQAGKPAFDRARGFAYVRDAALSPDEGEATGSMTACGVAVLEASRYALAAMGRPLSKDAAESVRQSVRDGLAWLDLHWAPFHNPAKAKINVYDAYWLYSVERALDLLDVQRLGAHFWYVEMAWELVGRQKDSGSWDTMTAHAPRDVLDTSFALLFLRRATKDVIRSAWVTGGPDDPAEDNR